MVLGPKDSGDKSTRRVEHGKSRFQELGKAGEGTFVSLSLTLLQEPAIIVTLGCTIQAGHCK